MQIKTIHPRTSEENFLTKDAAQFIRVTLAQVKGRGSCDWYFDNEDQRARIWDELRRAGLIEGEEPR
jgi:hypothetical protein